MNSILQPGRAARLVYRSGVRRMVNRWQQRRFDRGAPRRPLPEFGSASEAIDYINRRWKWGSDRARGSIFSDWSSHPEVVQARLEAGKVGGDCDDYAAWVCAALDGVVERVARLSVWTWGRGHTVAILEASGFLFVVDYELIRVPALEEAVDLIRRRYEYGAIGWVVETPALDLVAVAPDLPAWGRS